MITNLPPTQVGFNALKAVMLVAFAFLLVLVALAPSNLEMVRFPEGEYQPTPSFKSFDMSKLESRIVQNNGGWTIEFVDGKQVVYTQNFRPQPGAYYLHDRWVAQGIKPEKVWTTSRLQVTESAQGQGIGVYAWPRAEVLLAQKLSPKKGNYYYRWIIADSSWSARHVDDVVIALQNRGYKVSVHDLWEEVVEEETLMRFLLKITKE